MGKAKEGGRGRGGVVRTAKRKKLTSYNFHELARGGVEKKAIGDLNDVFLCHFHYHTKLPVHRLLVNTSDKE